MTSEAVFHRPDYARALARQLLQPGPLDQNLSSGVFLSGIRRIGKTTFIRQDFVRRYSQVGSLGWKVWLGHTRKRTPLRRLQHCLATVPDQRCTDLIRILEAVSCKPQPGACHAVRRACVPRISALAPSHGNPTAKRTTPTEAPRVPPKQNARARRLSGSGMFCSSLPSVVTPVSK